MKSLILGIAFVFCYQFGMSQEQNKQITQDNNIEKKTVIVKTEKVKESNTIKKQEQRIQTNKQVQYSYNKLIPKTSTDKKIDNTSTRVVTNIEKPKATLNYNKSGGQSR
jgi:hypothetical protein